MISVDTNVFVAAFLPPATQADERHHARARALHPKLEFSDAVIAARAEEYNAELASFDHRLAAVYDGPARAES